MESRRILVVDDDFDARELLSHVLQTNGYTALAAGDAEEALSTLREERVDLVVLDAVLPGTDGYDCLRRLREFSGVPVMMVSTLITTDSVVRGLDLGADDYLAKPFDRNELLSRMRAILRRTDRSGRVEPPLALPPLDVGPLHIDFSTQTARLGEVNLTLSGKELLLLYILAENTGMLLSRAHIFQAVWGDDVYDDSKTLDVHVSRLRKKLDAVGGFGSLLKTVRNRGYLLSSDMRTLDPADVHPPVEDVVETDSE